MPLSESQQVLTHDNHSFSACEGTESSVLELRIEPTQEGHLTLTVPATPVPKITEAGKELARKSKECATGVHTDPGKGCVSINSWRSILGRG